MNGLNCLMDALGLAEGMLFRYQITGERWDYPAGAGTMELDVKGEPLLARFFVNGNGEAEIEVRSPLFPTTWRLVLANDGTWRKDKFYFCHQAGRDLTPGEIEEEDERIFAVDAVIEATFEDRNAIIAESLEARSKA